MEALVLIAILCGLAYWAFRAGKTVGSKKGYHVGRRHERKRANRHRTGR